MRRTIFEPEHNAFRESVAAVLRRDLVPRAEKIRQQGYIDRELWRLLGEQGFLGFMVPEEHGGAGVRDFRFNAVLGEELSRIGLAYGSSIGINTDVVSAYLLELTTPAQKARWLPAFAAGELITGIGMTEPTAGSDLAGIRTVARQISGGWVLDGSKTFITNGHRADLVIVAAKTSPEVTRGRGITLFAVESTSAGFERGQKLVKVGQPEADTSELFFSGVRLTDENVIGEVDRGFIHMMERLPQERISSAVANLAHVRQVFEETVEYAGDRTAFGQPIGRFQGNRFALAEAKTDIEVTQAFVDRCVVDHVQGVLDPIDAAMAKYRSSEVQNSVLDLCVQMHGGYGYMVETSAARAWMDARVTRIWAGTNEIMREVIGRSLGA